MLVTENKKTPLLSHCQCQLEPKIISNNFVCNLPRIARALAPVNSSDCYFNETDIWIIRARDAAE